LVCGPDSRGKAPGRVSVSRKDTGRLAGRFERTPAPTNRDLHLVAERIAERTARWLRRRGYTFDESSHDREPDFTEQSAQASLRLGQLSTVDDDGNVTPLGCRQERHAAPKPKGVARGFDLHADAIVRQSDRAGRERLCRYILRPPLVLERLSLTADGRVAYERKYQSRGASHVVMTPVEFLIRLSALVFPRRHPILRYHGVFAAHHKLRPLIVPKTPPERPADPHTPTPSKSSPTRVQHTVAATPATFTLPSRRHSEGAIDRARGIQRRREDDVREALDQAVSADRGTHRARRARPSRLGRGGDAQAVGRRFQGGVATSGGERQKIAVARAFMAERADILILDEPTAALDAEAERVMFERFRELDGARAELVAKGGRYARLFALQAEGCA
jgi:hypothetical protein